MTKCALTPGAPPEFVPNGCHRVVVHGRNYWEDHEYWVSDNPIGLTVGQDSGGGMPVRGDQSGHVEFYNPPTVRDAVKGAVEGAINTWLIVYPAANAFADAFATAGSGLAYGAGAAAGEAGAPRMLEGYGMAAIGDFQSLAALEGQGYNILRVPSELWSWEGVNVPWLEQIAASGQAVYQAGGGPITWREIQWLIENGYYAMPPYLVPLP